MAPRRKCPICGSRRWRKDSASGMITCSEGHVLQNYRTESGDAEDYGTHTMRKRTLKSTREKGIVNKADPKLYHGDRARFHYYQCLQLLLRKQISALISLWNLPQEFEMVCRDLWALHLTLIRDPPPAEPLQHAQEMKGPAPRMHKERSGMSDAKGFGDDQQNSCARYSSNENSTDSELEALLQENSAGSSTASEDEDHHAKKKYHIKLSTRFIGDSDHPVNTVAVLVLACWTIRLPLVYMDIINAIEDHSIPYLDHVRLLPSSLTCHLTKHAIQALSPHHAPRIPSLHRLVSRLGNRLHSNFGLSIPELNVAPILWRVVRQCFCGTPMLYSLSKQLGSVLSLPISLHHSLAPVPSGVESRMHYNALPEVALASSAIVVLKLVYGLDGKRRQVVTASSDVACTFPDVDQFLATLREANRVKPFINNHPFSARIPMSVGDLGHASLDEYLDFCEETLVAPQTNEHRILDNYFPLSNENVMRSQTVVTSGPVTKAGSPMKTNDSEPDILRPGESYTIYHSEDVLGNVPSELDVIIQRACRWAGVSSDYLCSVVEQYERRLVRWWQAERQYEGGKRWEDGTDAAAA
ncbi:hypothetical protein M404DRAFT_123763 [Pisolithus tinctorius Marx 270]|uniref:RRN7-type domain-containing protein n=1 Tax=Pisolithus tinctorius Marx 270 TaxID=870435 RepID=A0A0C3PV65_PISTI|nr:hypothetical protein M404DRAFT_123763 [Pisolithus tinctorius Marx 270]